MNRYTKPRALYPNKHDAHQAACALNDRFDSYVASYRRIDDRTWEVEAKGITLPQFVKALAAAGLDGKCF